MGVAYDHVLLTPWPCAVTRMRGERERVRPEKRRGAARNERLRILSKGSQVTSAYAKMAASHDDVPAFNLLALEPFNPVSLASNVKLQRPLSRRGNGPALIIFVPDLRHKTSSGSKKTLDLAPLQKWAEEGFAVVEVVVGDIASPSARDALSIKDACEKATTALAALPECSSKGKFGAIGDNLESLLFR